jgi:predicted TIM-barrel fold metal-dependent hydrolase
MRELIEVVGRHSDRFLGFGSVPLGLAYEETGRWVEDYVIKNHFIGFGAMPPAKANPFPLVEHDHHGAHRTEVEVRGYSYRAIRELCG